MGYEHILYEVNDRIARGTLNSREKLNAWTTTMGHEVKQAMTEAGRDEAVRAIVLTGAGRGFCAGADMGLLSDISAARGAAADDIAVRTTEADGGRGEFRGAYAYFPTIAKPIIGALNGATAGLGPGVAPHSDPPHPAHTPPVTTPPP